MKKKMKHYDGEDGSVVETDTAQGQNEAIKDDTRARAMAFLANQNNAPAPKATPKAAPKATKEKSWDDDSKVPAEAPKKGADKLRSELNISKPSAPTMIRGAKNTGVDLKSALFGGSSESPRMKAAKRAKASDASNYSMKSGGKVSSASKRADGIAQKGKTRGKMC